MTRNEIFAQYDIRANIIPIIMTPGKFEGEPAWAPYFWELVFNGREGQTFVGKAGFVWTIVMLEPADRDEWPELAPNVVATLLYESDKGFVYCEVTTQAALDALFASNPR